MPSYYAQLVERLGVEGAKAYMRDMRSKVKTPSGFSVMDKQKHAEASRRGGLNRWKQRDEQTDKSRQPS